MDLLKTLVLYMTMVFASSVQTMPDAEGFMVQYNTPAPTAVVTEAPVVTPSPTPVPTIAISPNPEHKTLQVGDKGDGVLRLQQTLAEYGYYEGDLDGRYGNQTRYAVERFQYNHGLVADGIAGKHTLTVLYDSNQVRYAAPTPSPTPLADALTVALPRETGAAADTPVTERQDTPAPSETPAPAETQAPEAAPEAAETPVPQPQETVLAEVTEQPAQEEETAAEAAPLPVFEAKEGWVIHLAQAEQPLVTIAEEEQETVAQPVLPYRYGDTVYVPLLPVLEGSGVFVVTSDNSIEKIEIGFALGEHLYCLAFTEDQDGQPTGPEFFCDNEAVVLENADIRLADGVFYLPADCLASWTGFQIAIDEAAQMISIAPPAKD